DIIASSSSSGRVPRATPSSHAGARAPTTPTQLADNSAREAAHGVSGTGCRALGDAHWVSRTGDRNVDDHDAATPKETLTTEDDAATRPPATSV
ncbi:MAG: hypothetical protein KGI65_10050, partial [Acidobacteriota bacterium]|nr:hypothetical protein [Acidobacteriota bacterium]